MSIHIHLNVYVYTYTTCVLCKKGFWMKSAMESVGWLEESVELGQPQPLSVGLAQECMDSC